MKLGTELSKTRTEGAWRPVLLATLIAGCVSTGTIWFAQLNWFLFRYVAQAQFDDFFAAWSSGVQWIGLPIGLVWRPWGRSPSCGGGHRGRADNSCGLRLERNC